MKLAMSQTAMSGSIQENLDKTLRAIRRAGEDGADLIFPRSSSLPFSLSTRNGTPAPGS